MSDWSAESDLFAAGRFAFGPSTGAFFSLLLVCSNQDYCVLRFLAFAILEPRDPV